MRLIYLALAALALIAPLAAKAQPVAQSDYLQDALSAAPGQNKHIPAAMSMWCDDTSPILAQLCSPRVTSKVFPFPVSGTISDSNSAPYTVFTAISTVSTNSASPTAMPSGYRALAYTCTAQTAVYLLDAIPNPAILETVGASPGFHSFFSELPASFYVSGPNSCTFTAEK